MGSGGVPRQRNFNGLLLQTYGSARIEPKSHFGAVTNRTVASRKRSGVTHREVPSQVGSPATIARGTEIQANRAVRKRRPLRKREAAAEGRSVNAPIFTLGTALALEFNQRSEPQLELARWLESEGVDLPYALNVAGPIVEHDIVVFPGAMFDFAARRSAESIRAVVHVAVGEDAETPIDLVAWTRERPDRILRCLGVAPALGIDQLVNPASYFAGRPLRVHRSALAWLASGCDGVVPLDCAAMRNRLDFLALELDGCRLAAESLEHGRALRTKLAPLPARVRILVPRTEAA